MTIKKDNMVKWIDKIHEAIGGDYTDDCPIIEEAARELAMRLEWYYNKQMYIDAYNRQIKALAAIEGTEELREAITDKINNGHPYNIIAIQEIIDRGYVD